MNRLSNPRFWRFCLAGLLMLAISSTALHLLVNWGGLAVAWANVVWAGIGLGVRWTLYRVMRVVPA